jgi:hypothetical protein
VLDQDAHEHKGPLVIECGPRVRILVEHKSGLRPLATLGDLLSA